MLYYRPVENMLVKTCNEQSFIRIMVYYQEVTFCLVLGFEVLVAVYQGLLLCDVMRFDRWVPTLTRLPCRWRLQVPPKLWCLIKKTYGIISEYRTGLYSVPCVLR
jgi:hypothetical protein